MVLTLSIIGLLLLTLVTGNILGITLAGFGYLILYHNFHANFVSTASAIWDLLDSYTFSAVPTFILLGEIMGKSGVAQRIYTALAPLVERLPGKLLQTNVVVSTIFSAVNGSSAATVAVVGGITFDDQARRGYDRRALIGSIAGPGTLGILIPPSIPLIIYGSWQDVSIGRLFVAGIIPGLAIAAMFMIFIGVSAKLKPSIVPPGSAPMPLLAALKHSWRAWPFVVMIAAILGSVAAGVATPNESAALGVVAALLLGVWYRDLSWRSLWAALRSSVMIYSTLALILIGATVLSHALALTGLPSYLAQKVMGAQLSPILVMALIYGMYLVLGCFFAGVDMMLITLPFVYPVVIGLGYDPVWLGIVMVIVIEIAILTPPVGVNLFVIVAVTENRVNLKEAAVACVPYFLILIAALIIITKWPGIVLYLPSVMF